MRKFNPLTRIVVPVAVVATLILVLLPLGWMTLTAFKTRGTAFRLEFIPPTTATIPPTQDPAIAIPSGDDPVIIVGYTGPATEVQVTLLDAENIPTGVGLRFIPPDQWIGSSAPLPAGQYRANISVSGEDRTESWAQQIERGLDGEGFVVISHEGTEPTAATSSFRFTTVNGERSLVYTRPPGESYDVLFDQGGAVRRIDLANTSVSIPAEATSLRLVEYRSFSTAFASFYTLDNFRTILTSKDFHFGRFFLNSLIVALGAGFLTVFLCSTAAYAFAAKDFHYRDTLFKVLLASMLIPGMIYLVPQFSIVVRLSWLNTYQGMIVPHVANMFGLFLMRQYIMQIPKDLFAAAEIDGANDYQVFARIVVPVCVPIIITLFILVFVGQWSNFLWQLIVNTGDVTMMTLPVGLQQFKGQNTSEWELIMAGACFSLIPITVLFLSLQKYFMSGLTAGAVKE